MPDGKKEFRLMQRLRDGRHWPSVLCALLCYFFAGAIVPPGHMAASLASGTAFHLCPGDLRSALLTDALQAVAAEPMAASSHSQTHAQPGERSSVQASAGVPSGNFHEPAHAAAHSSGAHDDPAGTPDPGHTRAPSSLSGMGDDAGHGTGHRGHAAGDSVSLEKSSADPGCSFAGFGAAAQTAESPVAFLDEPGSAQGAAGREASAPSRPWLRPPARSPPLV